MIATYRQERPRAGRRFSPDGKLVAVGGPDTVQVHRCELCAPVRRARAASPAARLPDG